MLTHAGFMPVSGQVAPVAVSGGQDGDFAVAPQGEGFEGQSPEINPEAARIAEEKATAKVMEDKFNRQCETCKNRRYQDGSNDPGVSFKSPQHIDPANSASVVGGHEMEHVAHEQARAKQEGGKVLRQTVRLHGAYCSECGRYYVAGGVTETVTSHGGKKKDEGQKSGGESPGSGLNVTA